MTGRKKIWKRGLFILLAAAVLGGCKKETKVFDTIPPGGTLEGGTHIEGPPGTMVKRVSIQDRVVVSGNIAAYKSRSLNFSSTEKITAIEVKEGDWVTKGRVLARVDTSTDEYSIEAKEYELETLRYTEPPRKIKLLEKELASLKKSLENKVIIAPFDGIVASISQREGEISQENSKDPLILLIDKTKLKAMVVVDELDIARIALDQTVLFSFDALPGETFEGKVSKIAQIGKINQRGLPVIDIEIIIDDPDPRIVIPYSFKAEILVSIPADYLVVDEKAIIWRDDKVYVNLIDPEDPTRVLEREIKFKPWQDGQAIVLDGLDEGDHLRLESRPQNDAQELWF